MKASCSVLPDLDIAGEGETGADRAAGDLALEEEGGAGDRPRPGLRPRTRWRRQVSVMALASGDRCSWCCVVLVAAGACSRWCGMVLMAAGTGVRHAVHGFAS